MASNFYDMHLPDYRDLDNVSGIAPGCRLGVRENDGGIGLYLGPIGDDPDDGSYHSVFLNAEEARELVRSLKQAIGRAAPKRQHPGRALRPWVHGPDPEPCFYAKPVYGRDRL